MNVFIFLLHITFEISIFAVKLIIQGFCAVPSLLLAAGVGVGGALVVVVAGAVPLAARRLGPARTAAVPQT